MIKEFIIFICSLMLIVIGFVLGASGTNPLLAPVLIIFGMLGSFMILLGIE
jgi:hypothetical protein